MSRDTAAELLRAIYANPADDALRLVYADALEELGDPRAELIQLQFKEAEGRARPSDLRRIATLTRKHLDTWLGKLAENVTVNGASFEKGFLHRLVIAPNTSARRWKKAAGAPELTTLRSLELFGSTDAWSERDDALATIALEDDLPSLRALHVTGERLLEQCDLLSRSELIQRLDTFGYRAERISPYDVGLIVRSMPRLQQLRLVWTLAPDAGAIGLALAPLKAPLETLAIELVARQTFLVVAVLETLATLPASIERVTILSGPEQWTVDRVTPDRFRAHATAGGKGFDRARVTAVMNALGPDVPLDREL